MKKSDVIKVLIVDDHPIVRSGLRALISGERGMTVAAEAGDGADALRLVKKGAADVVLLDLSMPGKNGLDLLAEIRRESPELPVLVLSIHHEDLYGVRALRAGAAGYLSKSDDVSTIVGAVRRVAGGGRYISPGLVEKLASGFHDARGMPHEALSEREFQVASLIAGGKRTGEIAKSLSLSAKTVSTYRARILEKMRMRTDAELIRYCVENRVVPRL